jgi:hypothetical protein
VDLCGVNGGNTIAHSVLSRHGTGLDGPNPLSREDNNECDWLLAIARDEAYRMVCLNERKMRQKGPVALPGTLQIEIAEKRDRTLYPPLND